MADKRALVTGGSGFIASHLVSRLLSEGYEVAITTRNSSEQRNPRLADVWRKIKVIEADIRNRDALTAISRYEPDLVYHMAAYIHVGQSFDQVEECFNTNATGTANVLDASMGCKRFVYMSSSEVYGHQETVPWHETMEPHPISPYSITKYAGELYCRMYQAIQSKHPSIVCVRGFNVYGPGQSTKSLIAEVILRCLRGEPLETTKGEQTREYTYVSDTVDGLFKAGHYDVPGVVNIASGQEIRICDLVRKIAELTETKSKIDIGGKPYRPTEIWRMLADNGKAKAILGWTPKVDLERGLRLTVAWYRSYLNAH